MDKEMILLAINKIFDNKEKLTDEEMNQLKNFLISGIFLVDIPDDQKRNIINATPDTIVDIFKESMRTTIDRIFKIRYGL